MAMLILKQAIPISSLKQNDMRYTETYAGRRKVSLVRTEWSTNMQGGQRNLRMVMIGM